MSNTIQIPGRFWYHADAIPKGNRNARRIIVHAPILYEIEAVDNSSIRRDAVRIRTYTGADVSYAMHAGRLWRPANPANPVSLNDYRRMAQAWATIEQHDYEPRFRELPNPRKLALRRDPIAHSHGFHDDAQWPSRAGLTLYAEEDFAGQLLLSDRDAAHARYLAAAHHVLLIDNEIHFAAPEPLWEAGHDGVVRLIAPQPGMHRYDHYALRNADGAVLRGSRAFAADRRDAALAFAAETDPEQPHPIEGEVLSIDPSYVSPPAMSRAIQECFYWLFGTDCHKLLHYLSERSFSAFGALQSADASLSTYSLGELDRDPSALVEGLRAIKTELDGKLVPDNKREPRRILLGAIETVLQRDDFEKAQKPDLTEEDDLSIAAAAMPHPPTGPRP